MTDEDTLAAFLKGQGDTQYIPSKESARLHNKGHWNSRDKKMEYPDDNTDQVNFKVLIGSGRHSEFTIDEDGNFVSELEKENPIDNDVVNESSFNDATRPYPESNHKDLTDKQEEQLTEDHNRLDVTPPAQQDPSFRGKVIENDGEKYKSPNDLPDKKSEEEKDNFKNGKKVKEWKNSYYNDNGAYAPNGRSAKDSVNNEQEQFKAKVKEKRKK